MASVVNRIGQAWVGRLAKELENDADCVVLDPPFLSEEFLDTKGY